MRKRSARKWLHFILDLLPVIFIPVFMVYSHRHTIDTYTVTRAVPNTLSVKQYLKNGKPIYDDGFYTWSIYNSHFYIGNYYSLMFDLEYSNDNEDYRVNLFCDGLDNYNIKHKYFFCFNYFCDSYSALCSVSIDNDTILYEDLPLLYSTDWSNRLVVVLDGFDVNQFADNFDLYFIDNYGAQIGIKNIMFFDLTDIFGVGLEPSADVFNSYLVDDYYDFGFNELQIGTKQVTYNDTDILSQLTYAMYNATDKYFNFNSLFNMQSMYNWIETNFFGGNAPLIIPIVWNIIVYELFMDILFLIYAVFMFIVDFATNMVDSFLSKSSKGGY